MQGNDPKWRPVVHICEVEMALCLSEEGGAMGWRRSNYCVAGGCLLSGPLEVLALHSLFLYLDMPPPHHPSIRLAQAIFELNLFPNKYHNNLIPVIHPAYTDYEDGTVF